MQSRQSTWASCVVGVVTLLTAGVALRAAFTIKSTLSASPRHAAREHREAKRSVAQRSESRGEAVLPETIASAHEATPDQVRAARTRISRSGNAGPAQFESAESDETAIPVLGQPITVPNPVGPRRTIHKTTNAGTPQPHRGESALGMLLSVALELPRSSVACRAAAEEDHAPEPERVRTVAAERSAPGRDDSQEMPGDYQPWWQSKTAGSFRATAEPQPVTLDALVLGALLYSPRVRAVSNTPLIREASITEAEARFDWRSFMDSRFSASSDPVGSTLTTGGPSRFREQNWRYNAGLRRTTETGAKFEAAQRIGYQDNNSTFFDPTQQGNARLSLSFTQPLLNGAGRAYNQSLIVLAQIDADMANDEFSKLLQDHLLEVTRSYWELYLQRALLVQKQRLLEQATTIHDRLEHRRGVDALESQIVRAKAAVASRRSEIIRCEMAIRNTESKLRVLVNDPALLVDAEIELLPREIPARDLVEISLQDSLTAALEHRPEILQAAKNVRAAGVRLGISENELLPALDLVTEAYVSGLKGNSDIAGAYGDQFSEGQPSFTVGLVFEVPLHNRAAKARYQQRRLELQQLTYQLQQTTDTLRAEVEVAVRAVETAFREMHSKYRAMLAADAEVRYLTERWRLLPGEDQVASFLLEDLLDAQERQATEEADFVTAQVNYTVALAELKRATGTLLQAESVSTTRVCADGLPQMMLDKQPASAPSN